MVDRANRLKDDSVFSNEKEGTLIRRRYGLHDVTTIVREFIFGQKHIHNNSDVFVDTAQTIVMQDEVSPEIIEASKHLLEQQRMLEDTMARRRLEKWATKVISWYLIIVCILVITNGLFSLHNGKESFITGGIMIVILTTTTINVIGLGLIVLRGHFPQNKDK